MSKVVYWAPWDNLKNYSKVFLSYSDPYPLFLSVSKNINNSNKLDNFFKCPAFVDDIRNTYVFSSPTSCDLEFKENYIINKTGHDVPYDQNTVIFKSPSMLDAYTIRFNANWIFFAEEDLEIESKNPFMHNTPVSTHGFYVPGKMNIASWFRPLEYAFQCWPNHKEFSVKQDDPIMYVKFLTKEPIIFKKFYLTEELYNLSISCVRLKDYRRERNLRNLYNIFKASKIRNKILEEIKKNIMT